MGNDKKVEGAIPCYRITRYGDPKLAGPMYYPVDEDECHCAFCEYANRTCNDVDTGKARRPVRGDTVFLVSTPPHPEMGTYRKVVCQGSAFGMTAFTCFPITEDEIKKEFAKARKEGWTVKP